MPEKLFEPMVFVDLETTGATGTVDRITEIAAVRIEDGVEVARWSTLVNPGRWVSPFITSLTGIDNTMVADAPRFEAVAPRLLELLDGAAAISSHIAPAKAHTAAMGRRESKVYEDVINGGR